MPTSDLTLHGTAPAYQRWQLDDFGTGAAPARGALPTVVQIEAIREQARQEGYAAGQAEGFAHGMAQAREALQRLETVMGGLDAELQQFDAAMAERLVTLALDMARQLVRDSLTRHPEQVVDAVREAMQSLPPFGEHAQIQLHPQDASLVRSTLGEQLSQSKWKVMEDAGIERGGCRVQTASMLVDATLATRWQRMASTLARNDAWQRDVAPAGTEEGQP